MAGKQLKRTERGALLALLVALSEPVGIDKAAKGPAKSGRNGRRTKATPKYQSKKNKSLK